MERVALIPDRRILAEAERREHEARTTAENMTMVYIPPPPLLRPRKPRVYIYLFDDFDSYL